MMNQTHHPPHYQDLQGRTEKIMPTWQCQSLSKQDNYVNICCVCVGYQNYLILREENEFFFSSSDSFFMILGIHWSDTRRILEITRRVCFWDGEIPIVNIPAKKNSNWNTKILTLHQLWICTFPPSLVLSDFLTSNMNIWDKYNPGRNT